MSHSRRNEVSVVKTVRGYAVEVPSSTKDGSDDEDEDENEEEDNWLDYSQMQNAFSQGTFVKQFKKPQNCRVKLKDLDHPKGTHTCIGRFVLLDPWWQMTVDIGPNNRAQGSILYAVRQDEDGVKEQKLVPFLLNTALQKALHKDTAAELMTQFENFVRIRGKEKLTFQDLEPEMYQFTQTYPDHTSAITSARNSDAVQAILRGMKYPGLLSFLCRLFPMTFLNCLLAPRDDTSLTALQRATEEEPWVFGFKSILMVRFKVYGVEAGYKAFETAGLMRNIPPTQKDALYAYEVLKTDAARNGHTYLPFPDLRQHRYWSNLDHSVSDWPAALAFLTQSRVTVEERFTCQRNIFLYHNWKAEVDIAAGLDEVLSRGISAKKPTWEVDFASPDLNVLRGDADQWMAAQKMVGSPVCVMSGKGGCGKTTVVTQVIQHACQKSSSFETLHDDNTDLSDILANAELHRVGEVHMEDKGEGQGLDDTIPPSQAERLQVSSSQAAPPPPPITAEQVSQMIQQTTQSLQESQANRRHFNQSETKADQIQIDLTTDLIRYLATTGDTALSRTPVGRRILLTAPTGKAAKLLGHKAKMESFTLHRVIYSYRAFVKAQQQKEREERKAHGYKAKEVNTSPKSKKGPQPANGYKAKEANRSPKNKKDPQPDLSKENHTESQSTEALNNDQSSSTPDKWKYADTQVLVVDECSLVSLRIFATLLSILIENTPLQKVVLLGDVRQLPSIEPGNFLTDVFNTFRERGQSVELQTNHRSESDLIVSNATKISKQIEPVFDPQRHFHFCALEDSMDSGDPERDDAVRQLLGQQPELRSHETSQFVAFRRAHCDAINELCCKHYNNHATRKTRGNRQPYDFRIGDKICFRKNGQVLNQGKRLQGYLQDHPDILEAFGISRPKEKQPKEKIIQMNVTAAIEQIMDDDDDEKWDRDQQYPSGENCNQRLSGRRSSHEESGSFSREGFTDYSAQATDFGIKMERLSQEESAVDNLSHSTPRPRRQLKLGDIGTEDAVRGCPDPSQADDSAEPQSSQEKEDEEERAGKLKDAQIRLCNGEVFFIMDDTEREGDTEGGKDLRYLTLSDRDPDCPRVVCVSFTSLKRECRPCHAWARTIHTYQGSESDTVLYYVGESRVQNWKHVYTAVTRGRKSVFIIGKHSQLFRAVKERDIPRRSRLARRLTDMMKELNYRDLHDMLRQVNQRASAALTSTTTDEAAPHPSVPNPAFKPDAGMATPSPDIQAKRTLLDSFFDSDDSWVKDMSPVWAADYGIPVEDKVAFSEWQDSSDWCVVDQQESSPALSGVKGDSDSESEVLTPSKRQRSLGSQEVIHVTPKRLRSADPVDEILSPVRRNLKL